LNVNPTYSFHNHPQIDVLIVVGGVHADEIQKANVLAWIFKVAEKTTITASVCTGVFLLAEAATVTTQHVTTHWGDITELQKSYPGLQVEVGKRWIEDGEVITSAGISAGIDMSLHLVRRVSGVDLAQQTARQMEFDWTDDQAQEVKW